MDRDIFIYSSLGSLPGKRFGRIEELAFKGDAREIRHISAMNHVVEVMGVTDEQLLSQASFGNK